MELHFVCIRRRIQQAAAWPTCLSALIPTSMAIPCSLPPAVLPSFSPAALSCEEGENSMRERGAGLPLLFPCHKALRASSAVRGILSLHAAVNLFMASSDPF